MEDFKQNFDRMSMDLDKAKRTISEQAFALSDLRIRNGEVDSLKSDNAALSSKLSSLKSEFAAKEKEFTLQAETIRHHKATLQRELDATRDKISMHRQGFEASHTEMSRVRAELDSVIAERDRFKRELADKETLQAEQRLFELKHDLEQTVLEYHDLEKEKTVKDRMIQQFQSECSKEREKAALLKMQLSLLEEKLRVATQELSVYRGIDVYHSSMQVELQSYRKDRSLNDSAVNNSGFKNSRPALDVASTPAVTSSRELENSENISDQPADRDNRNSNNGNNNYNNAHASMRSGSRLYTSDDDQRNYDADISRRASPAPGATANTAGGNYQNNTAMSSANNARYSNPSSSSVLNRPTSPVLRGPAPDRVYSARYTNVDQSGGSTALAGMDSTGRFSLQEMGGEAIAPKSATTTRYSMESRGSRDSPNNHSLSYSNSQLQSNGTGGRSQTKSSKQQREQEQAQEQEELQWREDLDNKSIVSDLGSQQDILDTSALNKDNINSSRNVNVNSASSSRYPVADEYKPSGGLFNTQLHESEYGYIKPLSRTGSNQNMNAQQSMQIQTNASGNAADTSGRGSELDSDREEIQRRRAERKALRDQQLRDRILKEGRLARPAAEVRDDLSQSSASSRNSASVTPQQSQSAGLGLGLSRGQGGGVGGGRSSRQSMPNYNYNYKKATEERGSVSAYAGSAINSTAAMASNRFGVTPTIAKRASAPPSSSAAITSSASMASRPSAAQPSQVSVLTAKDIAAHRPDKTDFERARRLLSM